MSGGASTTRPAVAAAESAKPGAAARCGSARSSTVTASSSTESPARGRPSSSALRATPAMAAALTTLGCGVTSTTNPASAITATRTRSRRPPPHSATTPNAAAATSARLLPLTAVRCERPLAFIAASRSSLTARTSPTASPGSSSDPGSGSNRVREMNAARTSPAILSIGPPRDTCTTAPRANSTTAARSPASAPFTWAENLSTVPGPSVPVRGPGGTPIRTGTDSAPGLSPEPSRIVSASAQRRPSAPSEGSDRTLTSAVAACPASTAACSLAGVPHAAARPVAPATARQTAVRGALPTTTARGAAPLRRHRCTKGTRTIPSTETPITGPADHGTYETSSATAQAMTATGTMRRSRSLLGVDCGTGRARPRTACEPPPRRTLTREPDRGCRRAASRRCRIRRADRPRS